MQDRYAGDIGDYLKLAILRAILPGRRVGVGWWLHPDESHNDDGRHVSYLRDPGKWRSLDPELFDALQLLVRSGQRTVAGLEALDVLPGAEYMREPVPTSGPPATRLTARRKWFSTVRTTLDDCDFVFLDPDNGLEPSRFNLAARRAAKCVALSELTLLARPGRTLIVYHHQTRRKGGHVAEIGYWTKQLGELGFSRVDVIRASAFSARAFFLLEGTDDLRERARTFVGRWPGMLSWHSKSDLTERD